MSDQFQNKASRRVKIRLCCLDFISDWLAVSLISSEVYLTFIIIIIGNFPLSDHKVLFFLQIVYKG